MLPAQGVKVAFLNQDWPNPHGSALPWRSIVCMTRSIRRTCELRGAFPQQVATARQLVAFGLSERTVYKRCLDGGPWQRILPGIVLLFTGRPTRDQQVLAALLLCGPDALVTGLEACRRHGLRRGPVRQVTERGSFVEVHILIPQDRQVRSVGYLHVERTLRLPSDVVRDGFPLAPVPRSCTDAARRIRSRAEITELLSDSVQRGLCTVSALATEISSGSRRGTAEPMKVLADLREGVRSAAEHEAKKLWSATGLPDARWNTTIRDADGSFLGIVDCWLDDVAMVWEIESSEWHLSPADHDRTVERAAGFTAAGAVYLASKPKKLTSDRSGVIALLRKAYAQATARPRPALHAESPAERHPDVQESHFTAPRGHESGFPEP